mgnify:CR=1 FL=1
MLLVSCIYFGFTYLDDQIHNTKDFSNRIIYEKIAGLGAGEEWLPLDITGGYPNMPIAAYSDDGFTINGSKIMVPLNLYSNPE